MSTSLDNEARRVVVLDPESSDPTWGTLSEAKIVALTQAEWDELDAGLINIRNILDAHAIRDIP